MTAAPDERAPGLTMGLRAYRALSGLSGPVARYALQKRLERGKEDPARLGERMGEPGRARPDGRLVWIHGASVGESLSVLPLVQRLAELRPTLAFLVTTGTVTSAQLMAERLPANAIHQFIPLDHPDYVKSFVAHWRPDLCLFVESEFWPNLILETKASGAPMILVNGRISPKTYESWRKRPGAIRRILDAFDQIIAQDKENRDRLSELAGRDAHLFGNLKLAAPPLPARSDMLSALAEVFGARPVWLAASTHPGEEEIVLEAHRALLRLHPDLLLVLAPRHPVRGDEVADVATQKGLPFARRSLGEFPQADVPVYLADTLGELGLFYRLSDIAFVGGAIAQKGGHNPLEPARLHSAILHGPHTFNFANIYGDLRAAGGAALVRNERDLEMAVHRLLADEKTREAMANAAKSSADESARRVLEGIVEVLLPALPPSPAAP